MSKSSENPKIELLAQQLQEVAPQAAQIRVFFLQSNATSPREIWASPPNTGPSKVAEQRVIGLCKKRGRSVLIFNTRTEDTLRNAPLDNFGSGLCVPIFDESKVPTGFFLLSSPNTDAFVSRHRFAIEQIAQRVAPQFHDIQVLPEFASEKTRHSNTGLPIFKLGFALLGLILLGGLGLFFLPNSSTTTSPERTSSDSSTRYQPKELASQFGRHLKVGEFAQAWKLLDPRLQELWALEDFRFQMQGWSKSEENQSILLQRKLSGVRSKKDTAIITFFPSSVPGDSGTWTWTLERVEDHWRISKLEGGPLESY